MLFAHETELALQAAVVLANSAEPPDTMTTVAELDAFFTEYLYTGRHDHDAAELAEVRALRPALRHLLTSDAEAAAAQVNTMLSTARATPRLVRHDDFDWHIHAVDDDEPLATRIVVETAMAMIDLIRADELSRLGLCADADCEGIVLDLSRNRSRRYCSVTCGNRNAAAAYRARQSQQTQPAQDR
ncbi:CGNR zinc finger domain-containing protein [Actinotalea sp. BY-33]|uniref:CGNR zinc finger domain-containing protein n=1 Tax=Actinotalea soli TaxID=2819234 RepID=A0A939LTX5_9CELL|nr:CGNR zinc finger domain-containing protein [Actinotalea soli]MBO1751232.1 CGNR zinc finger domain-containing protein [Actinotalea soli]